MLCDVTDNFIKASVYDVLTKINIKSYKPVINLRYTGYPNTNKLTITEQLYSGCNAISLSKVSSHISYINKKNNYIYVSPSEM